MRGAPARSCGPWVGTLALLLLAQLGSLAHFGCASRPPSAIGAAVSLADTGQTERAAALLLLHLEQYPLAQPERRLLIRLYGSLGNLGAAQQQAETLARQVGRDDPLPWIELGHAQELAHRFDAALQSYDRAAAVAPQNAAGPKVGGLRAAAWGELDEAEPRLVEAVRRAPGDARAWHALGLVLAKRGAVLAAEQAYRAGLRADREGIDNRIGLATLALLRKDAAGVLREYDLLVAQHPRFSDAQLGRAWALIELGRFPEAESALRRAEELGAAPRVLQRQREWLASERSKSAGTR